MRQPKAKPRSPQVTCSTCRHFLRDTAGPSYNIYTHIYFMGTCSLGLDPFHTHNKNTGIAKVFADNTHECNKHHHE